MTKPFRLLLGFALATTALVTATPARAGSFSIARIYIEYNCSANDLGFHVSLDGEDWTRLTIFDPSGAVITAMEGTAGYAELGMTELFFEGAEPNLDDFPLEDLLELFPEGRYTFIGETVDGDILRSEARLSHAVPAGPSVSAEVDDDEVSIHWTGVTRVPEGFPARRIRVVAYQVISGSFQVTLPGSSREVTLPEEYVDSLPDGEHPFEVLAIDVTGNQTITEGTFELD